MRSMISSATSTALRKIGSTASTAEFCTASSSGLPIQHHVSQGCIQRRTTKPSILHRCLRTCVLVLCECMRTCVLVLSESMRAFMQCVGLCDGCLCASAHGGPDSCMVFAHATSDSLAPLLLLCACQVYPCVSVAQGRLALTLHSIISDRMSLLPDTHTLSNSSTPSQSASACPSFVRWSVVLY